LGEIRHFSMHSSPAGLCLQEVGASGKAGREPNQKIRLTGIWSLAAMMQRVTGPNITFPTKNSVIPDANCFVVTITDIKMNLKNGSSPSLFGNDKGAAASVCVEPHFDKLSLRESMWNAFLAISGSTYVDRSTSVLSFFGMLVQADGA